MKILHHGIWLLLAVFLQVTLLEGIAVFGISPNMFLVFTVVIGFLCGRFQGMMTGMVFGLVYDVLIGRFIGTSMLSFLFIGYFSAVFSDRFYSQPDFYVFSGMAVAATFIAGIVYLVPNSVVYNTNIFTAIFRIILPESIYNAILIIPAVVLINKTLTLCGIRKI